VSNFFDLLTQQWVTKFAIPYPKQICGNHLIITKDQDPELFRNPIRISQCSPPIGSCLESKCDQEFGFKASVKTFVTSNEFKTVWDLFNGGDLVCNPIVWPTPTSCLGFTPDAMCPCPTSSPRASGRRELSFLRN